MNTSVLPPMSQPMLTLTDKKLDGKATAALVQQALKEEISQLKARTGKTPGLRVILVGNDPASQVYVKKKAEMSQALGLDGVLITLPEETSEATLLAKLSELNHDPNVHGILVQLPLPKTMNTHHVLNAIAPEKDVDGFHPINMGHLMAGNNPPALPCTPAGMMAMLDAYQVPLAGKHAVVIGRSTIVGKPMAHLLLGRHCTVTIAHSKTQNLAEIVQQADIVVAAVGVPELITASMLKQGAIVLDVGINRLETGKLVGDVSNAPEVWEKVRAMTPVPGGVGPMTIAMLMKNTVSLFKASLVQS
ncbi:MAG: bifunctional methylenetetrahydrofolate dehydrogenase/methenyltetrahydrofolate cyclohydrolase FolD [Vampirovibrionales bacterium]